MNESLERFIKENHIILSPSYSSISDEYYIRGEGWSSEIEYVVRQEDDCYALYYKERNDLDLLRVCPKFCVN